MDTATESARELAIPSWLPACAAAWLLFCLTLLAYFPALRAGFVFDDELFLTANPLIKASDGLYRFWFSTDPPDYFPLTSSMLWVEWRLWGMNPAGYHVVNVLLHALGAVLVWRVLKRLGVPGSWLAAAIFAVHPVNVESVAWITERKNVLSMVLYLLTLWSFLSYRRDGRRGWYRLSVGLFLLALLAKTSVVMLPVVLLMCVAWLRGKVSPRDARDSAPFFVLSAVFALVTVWFQHHRAIGDVVVREDGLLSRLVGAAWATWFYLYKAILPYGLSIVYPRWTVNLASPLSYLPALALACVFAVLWRNRRGWARPALFALGYYVVTLLPVLGLVSMAFMYYSFVADRWQYLAIPGIIALVTGVCGYAYRLSPPTVRVLAWAGAGSALGVLCVLTWRQAGIYKSEETLWRATLNQNPDCFLAHGNLGTWFERAGNRDAAVAHLTEALRIKPDFADAHCNLGTILLAQGRPKPAIDHFSEALRVKPEYVYAHNNLAAALIRLGRTDLAIPHLQRAVELDPRSPERASRLAWILATHPDRTVREGTRAVRLAERACELSRYRRPDLLLVLAAAYAEAGRFGEARNWARKASDLAGRSGQQLLVDQARAQLKCYESSRPFRQAP